MKKFSKIFLIAFLALCMMLSFAACGDTGTDTDTDTDTDADTSTDVSTSVGTGTGDTYHKDMGFDYVPVFGSDDSLVASPMDTGVKTSYRMEAENAEFDLDETFYDYRMYSFGFGMSGGMGTRNCNTAGDETIFKFNSDKAVSCYMDMAIGCQPDNNSTLSYFGSIEANGIDSSLTELVQVYDEETDTYSFEEQDITVNSTECEQTGPSIYMSFKVVRVLVSLVEGENEIIYTHKVSNFGGNMDYIELQTSAEITGWDDTHYEDSTASWEMTVKPTRTATGTMVCTNTAGSASYTLPVLDVENGYDMEVVEGVDTFSFSVKNDPAVYMTPDVIQSYTLTLSEASACTFADGSTSMEVVEGAELPAITLSQGETRTLVGVYNTDTLTTYSATGFTMPFKNIEIAPYFAGVGETGTAAYDSSMAQWEQGSYSPVTGLEYVTIKVTVDSYSTVGTNVLVADQVGTVFGMSGSEGEYLRYNDGISVTSGESYTYTVVLENKGSDEVSFHLEKLYDGCYQKSTEGTFPAVVSEDLVLDVGETATVTMEFPASSTTSNYWIIMLDDTEYDAKIGVSTSRVTL